ncbi:MAG TPA: 30S ribosomal protein S20 [Candidatus Paceibacterota bacterium]
MAITKGAKKAIRSAARKRLFNVRRKQGIEIVTKQIRKLAAAGKKAEAQALLPQAYAVLDKAAKTHFLNKNAAARRKSRLAVLVKTK